MRTRLDLSVSRSSSCLIGRPPSSAPTPAFLRLFPAVGMLLGFLLLRGEGGDLTLARDGEARCVIVSAADAIAAERQAAEELGDILHQVTGATFTRVDAGASVPDAAILVGPGTAARALFPDVAWGQLDPEDTVIRVKGRRLLLAGGRPRGTLYAVSRFLQEQVGVRWWTPWASRIPWSPRLTIPALKSDYSPVFESRDPFWFPAFEARWAVRNFSNSQSANIPEAWGGCIRYKGFVHTFYPLVPPEQHFATHPEWYSFLNGKRTHDHAQLCLTNPDLRRFVVQRVREWLKESPEARIISVSQNDWHGACQCEACKAVDDAEGSQAGSLLDFVNHVAAQIESEFPHVAVDTLAYQYTRKPPKTLRPRPNVIVRLCSIECNFREPLDHPSNLSFADDIRGWAKICKRLYIWDYTTDFAHYLQPHPNWYTLGPNVRFFATHNVRGLFEQGAYQSFGSEFGELRAWVLAQLLWDPRHDDRALIDEFLSGYYGPAAPYVRTYLDRQWEASKGTHLTCFVKTDLPFHQFQPLAAAERLWDQAEAAVQSNPDLLRRVQTGRLWTRYVWLRLWDGLRKQCQDAGATWPLPDSKQAVAEAWLKTALGAPGLAGTVVTHVNESGLTPAKFVEQIAAKP